MFAKLPLLGFALVASLSGPAAAHEACADGHGTPAGYRMPDVYPSPTGYRYPSPAGYGYPSAPGYGVPAAPPPYAPPPGYGTYDADFRRADFDHDGRVSWSEALFHAREEFRREDTNKDGLLERWEVGPAEIAREDYNRDGVISYFEHQDSVRVRFGRLDANRDGMLARYEMTPADWRPWGRGHERWR